MAPLTPIIHTYQPAQEHTMTTSTRIEYTVNGVTRSVRAVGRIEAARILRTVLAQGATGTLTTGRSVTTF